MKKVNWKHIIGWTLAAVLLAVVISVNVHNTRKAHEGKFVVAVNIPLSGTFAQAFKSGFAAFKAGIQDELKAQGLPPDAIYIDLGDNRFNTTEAISIYNKQEIFGFDAYYVAAADTYNAILPKLKQKGKPVFFVSTSEKLFKEGAPNTIRLFPHLSTEMAVYEKFIQHKKAKNVIFVASEVMVAEEAYNDFIKPYCEKNGLNCFAEFLNPAEKDFRTVTLKIKEKNPDVILTYGSPNALYQLTRALKAYQVTKVLMAPVFFEMIVLSDEFPIEVKKDVLFVNSDFYTTKMILKSGFLEQEWVKNYMKEFGKWPFIYHYENGRLLVRGFAKYGKNVTAEQMMNVTPYPSIIGEIVMDKQNKELISTYGLSKVNAKGEIEKVNWEDI